MLRISGYPPELSEMQYVHLPMLTLSRQNSKLQSCYKTTGIRWTFSKTKYREWQPQVICSSRMILYQTLLLASFHCGTAAATPSPCINYPTVPKADGGFDWQKLTGATNIFVGGRVPIADFVPLKFLPGRFRCIQRIWILYWTCISIRDLGLDFGQLSWSSCPRHPALALYSNRR